MREHEGLLTPEELHLIEQQAKSHNADSYLKHYNLLARKTQKVRINNMMQAFWNGICTILTSRIHLIHQLN